MELVKEKYKQTEVGVIPTDWELTQLEKLTTKIGSGITPTGGASVYRESGRPFVRSQNIGWGNLILDDIAFIDDDIHQTFPNTEIKLNDVFLNITGASIGRSAYANEKLVGGNVNQHVCLIRITDSKLNPIYLNLFLLSKNGQKQIDSFQSGGNRQGLNIGQVKTFLIPLPPFPEQTAIASALSDMDALISQTEKLIEKKKAIKQGMMQQLLSAYDTEGRLKEGWEKRKLGECLLDIPDYGLNAAAVPFSESLPLYLRITDITDDGKYSKKNTVSVNNSLSSFFFLMRGDLVFARTGASVGKTYLYDEKDGKLVFAGFLIRVRSNPEILLPEYLKYYTQTKPYKEWIIANSMRTGQPGINGREFQEMFLDMPTTIAEQTRIAASFSAIEEQIDVLERKIEKQKLLKQAMMQSLLTGKIRIYKPEYEPTTQV